MATKSAQVANLFSSEAFFQSDILDLCNVPPEYHFGAVSVVESSEEELKN
ncbi:hypothetical protein [Flavobacterium limnosediminis]|nr:hypothetical protein [Flavobacterium limnosediminis]